MPTRIVSRSGSSFSGTSCFFAAARTGSRRFSRYSCQLLAVFPATAGFGFLLCLLALVPAFVAHRRTRKGTATNRRRAVAAREKP